MSMPAFPGPSAILKHDEAVSAVLTSIALEEAALSHILNAEGEKIQYALEHAKNNGSKPGSDMRMILDVNDSVTAMLEQITDLQFILLNKLNKALKRASLYPMKNYPSEARINEICSEKLCSGGACTCNQRRLNLGSSRRARVSEFMVLSGYRWGSESALYLNSSIRPDKTVKLCSRNGESTVLLPSKNRFKIDVNLKAHNGSSVSAAFEISLTASEPSQAETQPRILASRRYSFGPKTQYIALNDTLDWETPKDCGGAAFMIKLLSPKYLSVRGGRIKVQRLD